MIQLKIIDRYLLKELANPFFFGIAGFVMIMLGNTLFIYADLIIRNKVPPGIVGMLLLYNLPAAMVVAFPVAFLFAVLMALGRMAKDSEIIAIRAGGTSYRRLLIPVFVAALAVSLLNFIFNESVVPWANHQSQKLIQEMILKQPLPAIQEDIFFNAGDNRYFYIKKVDRKANKLYNIIIFEKKAYNTPPKVITAESADFTGSAWELYSGMIHEYDAQGFVSQEIKFDRMHIAFDRDTFQFFSGVKSPQEMSSKELSTQIQLFDKGGADTKVLKVDYYFKYSIPLASFFAAMIAAPLGLMFYRGGGYLGVGLSIVLVFIYYVMMSFSRSFGINGVLPPVLSAWSQNLLFGVVGLLLLWRVSR